MAISVTFSGTAYTVPEPGDPFTQSLTDLLNALGTKAGSKVSVPGSAGAAGVVGQWAADASYLYVCTATNTWKRVAIAAW